MSLPKSGVDFAIWGFPFPWLGPHCSSAHPVFGALEQGLVWLPAQVRTLRGQLYPMRARPVAWCRWRSREGLPVPEPTALTPWPRGTRDRSENLSGLGHTRPVPVGLAAMPGGSRFPFLFAFEGCRAVLRAHSRLRARFWQACRGHLGVLGIKCRWACARPCSL